MQDHSEECASAPQSPEWDGDSYGGSSDQEAVNTEVALASVEGREITDGCARTIASWYASGNETKGYAFVSTGAIKESGTAVWRSLTDMGRGPSAYDRATPADKLALDMLGTYLVNAGERGPVEGWSGVWVR